MSAKNFVIFYVDKPEASAAFYSALLNRPPVESSPTFALFALDSGLMLGLWSRHTVEPAAAGPPGRAPQGVTPPPPAAPPPPPHHPPRGRAPPPGGGGAAPPAPHEAVVEKGADQPLRHA
ncbi:hypothetical protein QGN07_15065, partial [Achromobacter xylosoxidans]